MSARILLVEDNQNIMNANRRMLELNGYTVECAATLEAARLILADGRADMQPDVLVLDIMLPDGSGLDFCREQVASGIPVLFLTALGENSDIVAGLRCGGDDYLSKPYDYDILLARIEALLRRYRRNVPREGANVFGPFLIDRTAHRVCRDGEDLLLKPREYALLLFFIQNAGVFLQPEMILKEVWAASSSDVRTVYAHISSLRKKLDMGENTVLRLEQRYGKGYRLMIHDTPAAGDAR